MRWPPERHRWPSKPLTLIKLQAPGTLSLNTNPTMNKELSWPLSLGALLALALHQSTGLPPVVAQDGPSALAPALSSLLQKPWRPEPGNTLEASD
ncbi:MAG: hypothetical protein ACK6AD_11860 [Cyanobacteriota bacterium]|jgi:hypothetical protein